MEKEIECLLEILDKTPKHILLGREIRAKLTEKKIPSDTIDRFFLECFESGLIKPEHAAQNIEARNLAYVDGINYVLTTNGLNYLNQLRVKNDSKQVKHLTVMVVVLSILLASFAWVTFFVLEISSLLKILFTIFFIIVIGLIFWVLKKM